MSNRTIQNIRPAVAMGVLTVAAIAFVIVIWSNANTRLRKQAQELSEQNAQIGVLKEENARLAQAKVAEAELERFRNEQAELLRLHGQVGALQNQLANAQQQAATNRIRRVPASDPSAIAAREASVQANARKWYVGDWVQAFHDFAFANNGQFPTNFAQAQAHHEKAQGLERPGQVGVSPRTSAYFKSLTPDEFEIVFQGSLNTVTNAVNTIVIRERQPRQLPDGRWARIYGFADGSTLQHIESDGNFENWERAPQRPERAPPAVRRYSFYGQR